MHASPAQSPGLPALASPVHTRARQPSHGNSARCAWQLLGLVLMPTSQRPIDCVKARLTLSTVLMTHNQALSHAPIYALACALSSSTDVTPLMSCLSVCCYTANVLSVLRTWMGVSPERCLVQCFLKSVLNVIQVGRCIFVVITFVTKQLWPTSGSLDVCSQMRHSCSCRLYNVLSSKLTSHELNSQSTSEGANQR